jgi:SAM-dependent methyltransferase
VAKEGISWLEFWKHLVDTSAQWGGGRRQGGGDTWQERAREFDERVKKKLERPDELRDFVIERLGPTDAVLDIGSGTGGWAIPLARVVRKVTAIDPSPAMNEILKENIESSGVANVEVIEGRWEDVEVPPHEVALCSHAMYGSPDFAGFVQKMESVATTCYFVIRLPNLQGVMADLCRLVKGHPHDSPNFIVAHNALLEMGRLPNTLIEVRMRSWVDPTLDDALQRAKRNLRLSDDSSYDKDFEDILSQRLNFRDGEYHWPDGMRSALVWWESSGDGSIP